ncbi:MAG: DsbE family thiol:disulfide interchange protein [Pseudomonadota bacterium]
MPVDQIGHPTLAALIDQPAPAFSLDPIEGYAEGFSSADLRGEVSLVNIFGSWCASCVVEHPVLMRIKASGGPPIYGVDWKDQPGAGTAWLARYGDPYTRVGDDADGRVAIDFGVTGAPETFVVDADGRIRHKHVGPITDEAWRTVLAPMVEELRNAQPAADRAADAGER